ncbi:major facilitator superfamily transporter [Fusarium albosuccineum]|uniref:Major facilitator superfamily transporter n=1 Tax=Fusarium albosuccineum TaxID=1237068 RepID=A0A8H4KYK8_9HYPO|nr:major facilitator superfamily transporter [Fusarium albosuccineum]
MECDIFYQTHPPFTGVGDRCSPNEVAAATAAQFSILGMTTTLCGTLNLFVAGWVAKRFGPKFSLLIQTFVPAIRAGTQILGVIAGGQAGIVIFQCTQLIAIIGGPAGYVLIVNIMASDVVESSRRTSVFGKLQGCIMLGQGMPPVGGMIGDAFGVQRPFEVAFLCFLFATLYVKIALPHITPEATVDSNNTVDGRATGFFAPLKILLPQRVRLQSGRIVKHYGVLFLCFGVFLGVLATDYAPFMIQMYATAEFDFNQAENGWLMSGWAIMRSIFLLFIFPYIITLGLRWFTSRQPNKDINCEEHASEIPDQPQDFETPIGVQEDDEPVPAGATYPGASHLEFDLFFLRWSLVIDGLLTTIAAFATHRWHIYLAAFLLPLGSGSAPAAKGVITDMCSPSQRADALNAVTLVENTARLATQGFFGFLFAFLAGAGQAYLTFFCNVAIALLAMGILLLSHFPSRGSKVVENEDVTNAASTTEGIAETLS